MKPQQRRFIAQAQRAQALPLDEPVPSPCMSVCRIHPDSGFCEGCWRTLEEITRWTSLEPQARRQLWGELAARAGAPRPR